jgi:hypothetical protein
MNIFGGKQLRFSVSRSKFGALLMQLFGSCIRRITARPLPTKAEIGAQVCLKYSSFRPPIYSIPGFSAKPTLLHCLSGLPDWFRQQAARQHFLLLLYRVEKYENQRYTNQTESGEDRVAGSNSGGGGNAPFFMRRAREVVHGRTVYGPKDGILSMIDRSSMPAITFDSPPHYG